LRANEQGACSALRAGRGDRANRRLARIRFTPLSLCGYEEGVLVKTAVDSGEIEAAIERMAGAIALAHCDPRNLVLAAIANGGLAVCSRLERRLAELYGKSVPKAVIDITFHRDDIGRNPLGKEVQATRMDADPEGSVIILVDDVIFSGRTARAAIAEVFTLGRPYKIELAVLVDRGNRRLPIAADYLGLSLKTDPSQAVRVKLGRDSSEDCRVEVLDAN